MYSYDTKVEFVKMNNIKVVKYYDNEKLMIEEEYDLNNSYHIIPYHVINYNLNGIVILDYYTSTNGIFYIKTYYDDGQLNCVYRRVNGLLDGNCKGYYKNGQLEFDENYFEGKLHSSKKYYEDGQLKSEENYINGNLISYL